MFVIFLTIYDGLKIGLSKKITWKNGSYVLTDKRIWSDYDLSIISNIKNKGSSVVVRMRSSDEDLETKVGSVISGEKIPSTENVIMENKEELHQ